MGLVRSLVVLSVYVINVFSTVSFQICESFVTDRGLFTDSDIVNFAYAHA